MQVGGVKISSGTGLSRQRAVFAPHLFASAIPKYLPPIQSLPFGKPIVITTLASPRILPLVDPGLNTRLRKSQLQFVFRLSSIDQDEMALKMSHP